MQISGPLLGVAAVAAASLHNTAGAQQTADFYKGKIVEIYSGLSPGGAYSAYARTLQRHLGRHLPGNPTVVLKSKPGGVSRVLANWLYNVAPRNGLVFGTVHERMGLEPRIKPQGIKFDGTKFNWIGSLGKQKSICVTWHTNKVKTIEDALDQVVIVGSSGSAAGGSVKPRMLNAMIGTKFKIVRGYDSGEIFLGMERGELGGLCGYGWASFKAVKPDWIDGNKLNLLLQFSAVSHKELKHVPLMMDLIKDPEDRQMLSLIFATQEMGRPYVAPPGVPKARVNALRRAFDATAKDPKFLAEAKRRRLEIDPISGEEIQALLTKLYKIPKSVGQRVAAFRKPSKSGFESKRAYNWVTVTSPIVKVKGRMVHFTVKGDPHQTKIHRRRTKITIAGKAAKRKALKAGMVCAITYPGNMGVAKQLVCN